MKKLDKQIFCRFLKEKNIFIKFKHNYIEYHSRRNSITFLDKITIVPEIINCSFSWYMTKEGTEFWEKINREWHFEFLKNKK